MLGAVLAAVLGLIAVGSLAASGYLLVARSREREQAARKLASVEALTAELRLARDQLESEQIKTAQERAERDKLAGEMLALTQERATLQERLESLARDIEKQKDNEQRLREAFESLSAKTLKTTSEQFLELAKQRMTQQDQAARAELDKRQAKIDELVKPISETLKKTEERLVDLGARVEETKTTNEGLRTETSRLARALSRPEVRGRYGEIQLRRVAELAGMVRYCDFTEQTSARNEDGDLQRPDMLVNLPNGRVIAIDAKCNTYEYVQAAETDEPEAQQQHLERFANHVADQIKKLSDKKYWAAIEHSPEFVVMFVPGDQFLDAALARKPDLLEKAAEKNVILASPSTLIGLLRAVAVGWREHTLAEEARQLLELGQELHARAATALGHAAKLGASLNQAMERYNSFVGSVDTRLIPTLKKFEETGVKSGKDVAKLPEITVKAKMLESAEVKGG